MTRIFPKDNDVVWVERKYSPCECPTSTIVEMRNAIANITKLASNWFHDGMSCQFLPTSGGGWKKGKIRITLEFIPDKPINLEHQQVSQSFPPSESPLDDLREQFDI